MHELTYEEGYLISDLREGGITVDELVAGGIKASAAELIDAGYPTEDLRRGGYLAHDLKVAGVDLKELKQGGDRPEITRARAPAAARTPRCTLGGQRTGSRRAAAPRWW